MNVVDDTWKRIAEVAAEIAQLEARLDERRAEFQRLVASTGGPAPVGAAAGPTSSVKLTDGDGTLSAEFLKAAEVLSSGGVNQVHPKARIWSWSWEKAKLDGLREQIDHKLAQLEEATARPTTDRILDFLTEQEEGAFTIKEIAVALDEYDRLSTLRSTMKRLVDRKQVLTEERSGLYRIAPETALERKAAAEAVTLRRAPRS